MYYHIHHLPPQCTKPSISTPKIYYEMSNPGNVAGGHKANLNNPNTSEESKQHSREVLEQELDGGNVSSNTDENKNPNNV